ncbi:sulfite exporter TauE/SafE family protein [Mycobacterium sp. Marseille-P9652]|uniref:sulfite exporter TauE/SafE family protein n=1 Tax=Mycobacterium sp. Marseille-P9652 TaxID=2654950 RepID=UPI0012E77450|nr:sulfite exporter TauE/SafE family protein [Mycobacterium sp. Marseille-P9652]
MTGSLILILAGLVAAFLNTAASSGSAVTIPVMIMIGLEPVVANASNRLPIVIGCATAAWTFHRAGHLLWRDAIRFSIPAAMGAVVGSSIASVFGDGRTTNLVIAAIVVTLLLLFANPATWLSADRTDRPPNKGPVVLVLMGLVGAWAGLIAVDSGTYALAVLVLLARFPIREANGIKVTALGVAALVSLAVFSDRGEIDWRAACLLALGSIVGALLGARLALGPHAAKWVFRLLVLVLVLEVVHLGLGLWFPDTLGPGPRHHGAVG